MQGQETFKMYPFYQFVVSTMCIMFWMGYWMILHLILNNTYSNKFPNFVVIWQDSVTYVKILSCGSLTKYVNRIHNKDMFLLRSGLSSSNMSLLSLRHAVGVPKCRVFNQSQSVQVRQYHSEGRLVSTFQFIFRLSFVTAFQILSSLEVLGT